MFEEQYEFSLNYVSIVYSGLQCRFSFGSSLQLFNRLFGSVPSPPISYRRGSPPGFNFSGYNHVPKPRYMIKYSDTEGTNLTVHGMDTYLLRYNQTPHFEPGNIILSQSFTKKKKQNFFG